VRNLAKYKNTVLIALLDCCRVEQKGHKKIEKDIPGQLALIHAAEPGKTALGGVVGECSQVTKDFLALMNKSSLKTF